MASPAPALADSTKRRRATGPGFRAGCSGCVMIAVLGMLFWSGMSGLEQWLRARTFGAHADLVIVGRPENHANPMFWIGAVTLVLAVAVLAVRSAVRAIAQALLVLAAGAAALGWTCYRHFDAMRPGRGSEVELIYLWPRSSVRVDARDARLSQELDASYGGETAGPVYHLMIEAGGTRYSSASSGDLNEARRFLILRGAREGRP